MNYAAWENAVPQAIAADSLWKMQAYRYALFLGDICWQDVSKLVEDRRMQTLSNQLYRAVGSISANLAEGYSRGTGKDRARFYEYALGSARESRDWYYKSRFVLGDEVIEHRLNLLTEIIRLLLTMIPQQRGKILKENPSGYQVESNKSLNPLLSNIPFTEE